MLPTYMSNVDVAWGGLVKRADFEEAKNRFNKLMRHYPKELREHDESYRNIRNIGAGSLIGSVALPPVYNYFGGHVPDEDLSKLQRHADSMNVSLHKETRRGAAYDPNFQQVHYNQRAGAGTVAHELGHAQQHVDGAMHKTPHILSRRYMNKKIPSLAALAVAYGSDNEALAGTAGLGNLAIAAPTLMNEIDASFKGSRLLKNLGIKGRLGAFVGLPSYMVSAGLPAYMYGARKQQGHFDPDYVARKAKAEDKFRRYAQSLGT